MEVRLAYSSCRIVVESRIFLFSCHYSLKVSYASSAPVKAVLVKDKPAKAENGTEPQQYIEVRHFLFIIRPHPSHTH